MLYHGTCLHNVMDRTQSGKEQEMAWESTLHSFAVRRWLAMSYRLSIMGNESDQKTFLAEACSYLRDFVFSLRPWIANLLCNPPNVWQYQKRGSISNLNFPKMLVKDIALYFWFLSLHICWIKELKYISENIDLTAPKKLLSKDDQSKFTNYKSIIS